MDIYDAIHSRTVANFETLAVILESIPEAIADPAYPWEFYRELRWVRLQARNISTSFLDAHFAGLKARAGRRFGVAPEPFEALPDVRWVTVPQGVPTGVGSWLPVVVRERVKGVVTGAVVWAQLVAEQTTWFPNSEWSLPGSDESKRTLEPSRDPVKVRALVDSLVEAAGGPQVVVSPPADQTPGFDDFIAWCRLYAPQRLDRVKTPNNEPPDYGTWSWRTGVPGIDWR